MFGVYVHVPFCSALCPYCDFAVVVGRPEVHERYLEAVVAEARSRHWGARAGSLFIGGGTPTFVDPALLAGTITRLREIIDLESGAEITIEANPESTSRAGLQTLRDAGVNRVSIGAQSFDEGALARLGRTHAAADIPTAVACARAAGIDNVSLDLIYGAPGESDDDWRANLRRAIELGVDHVSCYALTIEDRTAFGKAVKSGKMAAPDDDALAMRFEIACDLLGEAGFEHYEISNWARPGMRSRHNLVYWMHGEYLGLGLGAHSHRAGTRTWNTRNLPVYLGGAIEEGTETLDERARGEEWISLRVRLLDGVDLEEAGRRLGAPLQTEALQDAGLVELREGRMLLTRRGMLLENLVTGHLIGNSPEPSGV